MSVQGSVLVLHRGARSVSLDELREVHPPAPVGRWHPIAHARVVDVVTQAIGEAGYAVRRSRFGLTPDGHRCFGTLDLDCALAHGVSLSVGIRNSSDKSFPLGFCAGSRVFCCDNLAFRAELLVKRKHTRYGEQRFVAAIAGAVTSLKAFQQVEAERIERFARTEVSPDAADALILRSFERGVIGARELPRVIREWRSPVHAEFRPRTVWSLFNAFTSALKDRSLARPSEYAVQTMRLNGLLDTAGEARALPPAPPAELPADV